MRHKEVLEVYRLFLAGIITLFGGLAVQNLILSQSGSYIIAWDSLVAYLLVSIITTLIIFQGIFGDIRQDIELIEGFENES